MTSYRVDRAFDDHKDIRGGMHAGRHQRVAGGGQTSVPWRLSRSVRDSVGLAGAEFAPNADSALEMCWLPNAVPARILAIPARSASMSEAFGSPAGRWLCKVEPTALQTARRTPLTGTSVAQTPRLHAWTGA